MLLDKIRSDMQEAKKSRETLKANLLSTLYAEIFTQSKSDKGLTSEDEIKIIRKFIKNIDETLSLDISAENREKFTKEKEILEHYLPRQLSEDEIISLIKSQIAEGKTMKDIMSYFKEKYPGQYDGKLVSGKVKELLS
ncbi:MAG: GatB/YqeY domain-containing protein [Ignavibacteria bacterium]|nr:GatB/YqeY domain-containing protein [Ignavibacteria bacterium]